MLTLFTGRFQDLLLAQQAAIRQLPVRRYVEDIFHVHPWLEQFDGLTTCSSESERVYAIYFEYTIKRIVGMR